MDELDPLEPYEQVFSGTISKWRENYAELVTESGLVVRFITHGHTPVAEGGRVTIKVRKYRPCYHVDELRQDS